MFAFGHIDSILLVFGHLGSMSSSFDARHLERASRSHAKTGLCWGLLGPLGALIGALGALIDGLGALIDGLGAVIDALGAIIKALGAVIEALGPLLWPS